MSNTTERFEICSYSYHRRSRSVRVGRHDRWVWESLVHGAFEIDKAVKSRSKIWNKSRNGIRRANKYKFTIVIDYRGSCLSFARGFSCVPGVIVADPQVCAYRDSFDIGMQYLSYDLSSRKTGSHFTAATSCCLLALEASTQKRNFPGNTCVI